jgi:hypothetical protein
VLALFALALPLVGRPMLLLASSLALYLAARWLGLAPPAWRGSGWFFNPLAWQVLFAIGVVMARADPTWLARRFAWNRWIAVLAVLGLLAAAVVLNMVWHGPGRGWEPPEWLAAWLADVDKTGLHPARLVSVLVMTWLLAHLLPVQARFLSGRAAGLFILMGQQSLPVFCAGIFLSFLGRLAIEVSAGLPMQAAVNVAGLAALILIGAVSAWYSGEGGRKRPGPQPQQSLPAAPGAARP